MFASRASWALLLILFLTVHQASVTQSEVHIYSFEDSSITEGLLEYFAKSNYEVIFHSLNSNSSLEDFVKIVETLMLSGIPVVPQETCIPCESHLSWKDILTAYNTPLIGFSITGISQL